MSDNLRRYRAIKHQLLQPCPNAKGRALQHLTMLAALMLATCLAYLWLV